MSSTLESCFPEISATTYYTSWPKPKVHFDIDYNGSIVITFKEESGFLKVDTETRKIKMKSYPTKNELRTMDPSPIVKVHIDQTLNDFKENNLDKNKITVEYDKNNDLNINQTINIIRCFECFLGDPNGKSGRNERSSILG